MSKVTVRSNWGYWDELDGEILKNGERVNVRWPDGSETQETVRVEKTSFQSEDHGHRCDIPVHKAYVDVNVRGVAASIRLAGADLDVTRCTP
jgi:hypothetical protein